MFDAPKKFKHVVALAGDPYPIIFLYFFLVFLNFD